MARWLTTASSEFEAQMISDRLGDAGVQVLIEGAGSPRPSGGPRDIYVDDGDFERAHEALRSARGEDDADGAST
jgi:hypothetical protein